MRYQGSEAFDYEAPARRSTRREREADTNLEIISGDRRAAQRAAKLQHKHHLKMIAMGICTVTFVLALGFVLVALTAGTQADMQQVNQLQTQERQGRERIVELQAERSSLVSNERIAPIVTQRYGMELSPKRQTISVDDESAAANQDNTQSAQTNE